MAQFVEDESVGGREVVLFQFIGGYPFESGAIEGLGFVLFPGAAEEFQMDSFFWVLVGDTIQHFADSDFDAEFFAKLACQTLVEGFARLPLAAWKFPESTEMSRGVALGDKELAVAKD